jgi:hypothetical protein
MDARRSRWIVLLPAIMMAAPVAALEASQINGVRPGMSYAEARERLLEYGYQGAGSGSARCPSARADLCRLYAREFEDCAGTGAAPCLFVFRYPRGRTVVVATEGERPVVRCVFERTDGAPLRPR